MIVKNFISQVYDGTGVSSDDTQISKRFIYNELLPTRAELIKQELNKDRLLDGSLAQGVSGFKLMRGDISQTTKYNTTEVFISELDVPQLIEYDKGLALFSVYTMMGKHIVMTDKKTWYNKIHRRHVKADSVYGFIDKGKLVIDGFGDLMELEVDLQGFFYDPVAAGMLSNDGSCSNEEGNCKPAYEYEVSLPGHIARRTIEIVRQVVFRVLGVPLDNSNDSMSDAGRPQAQQQNQQSNANQDGN